MFQGLAHLVVTSNITLPKVKYFVVFFLFILFLSCSVFKYFTLFFFLLTPVNVIVFPFLSVAGYLFTIQPTSNFSLIKVLISSFKKKTSMQTFINKEKMVSSVLNSMPGIGLIEFTRIFKND